MHGLVHVITHAVANMVVVYAVVHASCTCLCACRLIACHICVIVWLGESKVVGGDINHNFALASRNLPSITVLEVATTIHIPLHATP